MVAIVLWGSATVLAAAVYAIGLRGGDRVVRRTGGWLLAALLCVPLALFIYVLFFFEGT